MNPWKLEEEQEGTRDEAESPLCGRALAEQGDEGQWHKEVSSRPVWTKVADPSEDCVLRYHAQLKIQRYFWSLEIKVKEY